MQKAIKASGLLWSLLRVRRVSGALVCRAGVLVTVNATLPNLYVSLITLCSHVCDSYRVEGYALIIMNT